MCRLQTEYAGLRVAADHAALLPFPGSRGCRSGRIICTFDAHGPDAYNAQNAHARQLPLCRLSRRYRACVHTYAAVRHSAGVLPPGYGKPLCHDAPAEQSLCQHPAPPWICRRSAYARHTSLERSTSVIQQAWRHGNCHCHKTTLLKANKRVAEGVC